MDAYLMNPDFEVQDYLEGYQSFIWTERYDAHGDAILTYSLEDRRPEDFPLGWYITLRSSNDLMRILSAEVTYDPEEGRILVVTARALTGILEQRVVWGQTNLSGNLEDAVQTLLNRNILSPSVSARKVPNLTFRSSDGTVPIVYTVDAQYNGENLYSTVSDLCASFDIGFRITHETTGQFIFQLYGGKDRSYGQDILPYVVFSPENDNLANGRYFVSDENYANVVLVTGERDGNNNILESVSRAGTRTGLGRFEHHVRADNRSSNSGEIPGNVYRNMLQQQGREYLALNQIEEVFDGEADPTNALGYNQEFFLGDIVQISDQDIISAPARIVEYIRSNDKGDGYKEFPALRIINDD